MQIRSHPGHACLSLLLVALVGACGSAPSGEDTSSSTAGAAEPAAGLPWTREFQVSSTLVAREVLVEGPPGLIHHVAFKQHPDQKYVAKTTADGFLQEVTSDREEGELIRIQIDNLAIAAEWRIRVLERVVEGPVRVHATGDVFYKNLETGQETRSESLDLTGARPR
jgi:ribosomal protein S28E/S33